MYTYKVVIHPNNKQRTKILRTMNKCIECQNIIYDLLKGYLDRNERIPSCLEIRKMFTLIKKEKDEETINKRKGMTKKEMIDNHLDTLFYDVSNDALKQTVKDTYKAFIRFFRKESKFPNKKNYKDKTKSFYVDPYKIEFTDKKVKLEKIANNLKTNRQVLNYISLAEKNRIPQNVKYYNPRVVFDGDRFYIVVAVDDEYAPKKKIKEKVDEVIGIDLNVSTIVLSNNKKYKSINKEKRIKKTTRKLKLLQRKSSRRYLNAFNNKKKLKEAKNFIKIKKLVRKCYRRLSNLRDDYINKVIDDILYKPPKRIVIETLDIKSMQQNKKISSLIQISSFRNFINTLKEKCNKEHVLITEADKYYPSSKMCSTCGSIKKDLLLSDRVYYCEACDYVINRDLNAAINLAKYIN